MTKEEQRWAKLFQYLELHFKAIAEKFAVVDGRFNSVETTLENLMGLRADDEVWHDRWIRQLARKAKLNL